MRSMHTNEQRPGLPCNSHRELPLGDRSASGSVPQEEVKSDVNVFLVIRDDGNSQVAEESIDSVWLSREDAAARQRFISRGNAWGIRIEQFVIGVPVRDTSEVKSA